MIPIKRDDLDIFEDLNESLIDEIKKSGRLKSYPKGYPAMDSNDTLKYFYIILQGRIKVYQYNFSNNKEQTLYLLTSKDMFDVLTVLDGKSHDVMTEAIDDAEALELPVDKVKEWLENSKSFNTLFSRYVAKQMRQIEELASDLSLLDTSSRLIKLILKNLDLKNPVKHLEILQGLSHEEIASLIGSVRHVVNRHLQQLKSEGILNIERKKLAINNIKKLLEKVDSAY